MSSSAHLIFSLFLISAASTILATDHIVGANRGWNPGMNYTLWANNHTFYVGDLICNLFLSLCPLYICLCAGSVLNNQIVLKYSISTK